MAATRFRRAGEVSDVVDDAGLPTTDGLAANMVVRNGCEHPTRGPLRDEECFAKRGCRAV